VHGYDLRADSFRLMPARGLELYLMNLLFYDAVAFLRRHVYFNDALHLVRHVAHTLKNLNRKILSFHLFCARVRDVAIRAVVVLRSRGGDERVESYVMVR